MAKELAKEDLTEKQLAFVREYVIDFNATHAAIRAGYSRNGASVQGKRLLSHAIIQKLLAEEIKGRADRTQVTAQDVLIAAANLAFFDPRRMFDENGNLLNVADMDADIAQCIDSFEVKAVVDEDGDVTYTKKVKMVSRLKALELVGKHVDVKAFEQPVNQNQNNIFAIFGIDGDEDDAKRKLAEVRDNVRSRITGIASRIGEGPPVIDADG